MVTVIFIYSRMAKKKKYHEKIDNNDNNNNNYTNNNNNNDDDNVITTMATPSSSTVLPTITTTTTTNNNSDNGDMMEILPTPLTLTTKTSRAMMLLSNLTDDIYQQLISDSTRWSESTLRKHQWVEPMWIAFCKQQNVCIHHRVHSFRLLHY